MAAAGRTVPPRLGPEYSGRQVRAAVGRVVDAGVQRVAVRVARGPAHAEVAVGAANGPSAARTRGARLRSLTVEHGAVADELHGGRSRHRPGPAKVPTPSAAWPSRLQLDARVQQHAPVRVQRPQPHAAAGTDPGMRSSPSGGDARDLPAARCRRRRSRTRCRPAAVPALAVSGRAGAATGRGGSATYAVSHWAKRFQLWADSQALALAGVGDARRVGHEIEQQGPPVDFGVDAQPVEVAQHGRVIELDALQAARLVGRPALGDLTVRGASAVPRSRAPRAEHVPELVRGAVSGPAGAAVVDEQQRRCRVHSRAAGPSPARSR